MALSIRQPWAWLIASGCKNVENRTWRTRNRGSFLVHASSSMTSAEYDACVLFVASFAPSLASIIPPLSDLPLGGIVGRATLLDCVTSHPSEWFCGPYGFVVSDAVATAFIPCKGRLGFWRCETSATGPQLP